MENKSVLKAGAIKDLQEHIALKIRDRGFADETVHERLLLLVEEVGELANAIRHVSGMNVDQNRAAVNEVGEEVVDIINFVFAVAIAFDIDVESEFIKKDAIVDQRMYQRSQDTTNSKI